MDKTEVQLDAIPESTAAETAYHLALIPILGLFFYIGLLFYAFYQISKGMDGLRLLRKGFWRMLRMTSIGVVALAAGWFCPYRDTDKQNGYNGKGFSVRSFELPAKTWKMWRWTFFYNGTKYRECDYWLGKRNGKWTSWWFNGRKKEEGQYADDMKDGIWTSWGDDGERCQAGRYQHGKREGLWTNEYVRGIIEKVEYKNDQMDGKWICVWGSDHTETGEYRNGKKHGIWTNWWSNGKKWDELEYENGKRNGKSALWDKFGQKVSEGQFKNDLQDGKWMYWYDNSSQKDSEGFYVNGKENGRWIYWFQNGNKYTEGDYSDGKMNGKWTYWDESGNLEQEETYTDGKLIKTVKYKDGQAIVVPGPPEK